MIVTREITIAASAERVWDILGPNYADAAAWASSVYVSRARQDGPVLPGAPLAGRTCETSLGPFTETIETYDPADRRVAYSATGAKMPGFVKRLSNEWIVEPEAGAARVRCTLTADIAFPFNLLMGPLMRLQFGRVLKQATQELKHYAETGRPHPRKIKVDQSSGARAARAALV
ncbi:MAG: SRPBCC family protein [Pseudomonadota bacterium]